MVSILPPDGSMTFIVAVLLPLIVGFLVGIVVKSAVKIGAALAAILLILIVVGMISPSQVLQPILSLIRSGPSLLAKVSQLAGYLPYSAVTFIVGLVVGFLKG